MINKYVCDVLILLLCFDVLQYAQTLTIISFVFFVVSQLIS